MNAQIFPLNKISRESNAYFLLAIAMTLHNTNSVVYYSCSKTRSLPNMTEKKNSIYHIIREKKKKNLKKIFTSGVFFFELLVVTTMTSFPCNTQLHFVKKLKTSKNDFWILTCVDHDWIRCNFQMLQIIPRCTDELLVHTN